MFNANDWLETFQARVPQRVIHRPTADDRLAAIERQRVAGSIATFQLGEQSAGRTPLSVSARVMHDRTLRPRTRNRAGNCAV